MFKKIYNEKIELYNLYKDELTIYKLFYDSQWNIELIENYEIESLENIYKLSFNTDDIDCYYIINWGNIQIVKNGFPQPLLILYFPYQDNLSLIRYFNNEKEELQLNYLDKGIYFYEPDILDKAIYVIPELEYIIPLNYDLKAELLSNFIRIYEGTNIVTLNPDLHSKFNEETGKWEYDSNYNVKISDIAYSIAYEYGLNIDINKNNIDKNHIRNIIKYFRYYDKNLGRYLYYIPGFTPLDNINNFEIYDKNMTLKPIEILVNKELDIITKGQVERALQ